MAQPDPYNRNTSFTNEQAKAPLVPPNGRALDAEFSRIKRCFDQILANLALIQRDDTQIQNATVGYDQLKAEVFIGINAPRPWVVDTNFFARDTTFYLRRFYICLVPHTAVDFAADLARGYWRMLIDFTQDAAGVQSVFGRAGPDVVAMPGDYDATEVSRGNSTVEAALDALEAAVALLQDSEGGQEVEDLKDRVTALEAAVAALQNADAALDGRLDALEARRNRYSYDVAPIGTYPAGTVLARVFAPVNMRYVGLQFVVPNGLAGAPGTQTDITIEGENGIVDVLRFTPGQGWATTGTRPNIQSGAGTTVTATLTSGDAEVNLDIVSFQFVYDQVL